LRKRALGYCATVAITVAFIWHLLFGAPLLAAAGTEAMDSAKGIATVPSTSEMPSQEDSPAHNNSHAVKTDLSVGHWRVGTDIPPGRYVISAVRGTGNTSSVKRDGRRGINEIFSAHLTTGLRVGTVTTDLEDNEIITIERLGTVSFVPAVSEMRTTISSGTWIVGIDVPAGTFSLSATRAGEQGTVSILTGEAVTHNEILGTIHGVGHTSMPLTLTDGQILSIHGLNRVELHERN
jgi:hypothetical protein